MLRTVRSRRTPGGETSSPVRTLRALTLSVLTMRLVGVLGPGLVTGAADDDPSGIAAYSQIGAQFGFTMLWTLPVSYPLMVAIQEASAWIARVSGAGLARNIRLHYPSWI